MKAEDTLLILMAWRTGDEPVTIAELYREATTLGFSVDKSTVNRIIHRLRGLGFVSCLGHDQVRGQWLVRLYALTSTGRVQAQQRRAMMESLLNTPPQELHG